MDREGLNHWCKELPFKNCFVVKKPGHGGGLALLWKEDIGVDVFNFSDNQISTTVAESDGFQCVLTGFYGWPEMQDRYKS